MANNNGKPGTQLRAKGARKSGTWGLVATAAIGLGEAIDGIAEIHPGTKAVILAVVMFVARFVLSEFQGNQGDPDDPNWNLSQPSLPGPGASAPPSAPDVDAPDEPDDPSL